MEKFETEQEFEEICEQYMPMVYGLIRKWNLGSDKEDYIQTGRIALYEAWSRYDGERGAFAAYAKSYVYGRIKQSLERKDRWQTRNVVTEPLEMNEFNPMTTNAEDMLILYDWLARTNLSPREKRWVLQGLFNGHKPQEIAAMYNVAVSTVKTWRKTALKKLREEAYDLL